MNEQRKISGYVLAGGASSRFGKDKALTELQGKSMLARTVDLVSVACEDVSVVAASNKLVNTAVETILDRWPGEGPLGGILTALLDAKGISSQNAWSLIVSCDMPFLTVEWLSFLSERAKQSGAEVVVPRSSHGWEPLCACWQTSAAEILTPLFEAGTRKVMEALNALHMEVLDEKDWKRFDTNGRLFWNMNTVADYEEARRVIAAEKA